MISAQDASNPVDTLISQMHKRENIFSFSTYRCDTLGPNSPRHAQLFCSDIFVADKSAEGHLHDFHLKKSKGIVFWKLKFPILNGKSVYLLLKGGLNHTF